MLCALALTLLGLCQDGVQLGVPGGSSVSVDSAESSGYFTIHNTSLAGNGSSTEALVTSNGGFTVTTIELINGGVTQILTEGLHYEILSGTNGSSRVKFNMTTPPAAGWSVKIYGSGSADADPQASWLN